MEDFDFSLSPSLTPPLQTGHSHVPPSTSHDDNAAPKQKFSCHQCRARKLKCDRIWPCQRCVQFGEQCQFAEARRRPGHVVKRPRVKELENRLMELEHRFKQQQVEQQAAGTPATPVSMLDAHDDSQVIPTGRLEQLPPQSVVDELTTLYFSRLHSEAPMQDPLRYLASLHRPPHLQPPICLQYAILAMAAGLSPPHKQLALPFYQRARNYIEHDELKSDGHNILTLGHAQCWVLLGHFEAQRMWYARASLSVSRCVRLAQMLGLYDVEAVNSPFALAPTINWQEREERRRTMWAIFCTDRLASSTTGWHPLVDVKHLRTLLPASEEAFRLGVAEPSMTLQQALGDSTARLSSFACCVLTAYMFYACLEHSFTGYPDDDAQGTEFWKNQHSLDNRLAVLFMVLPDSVRCPENIDKHDAVFINLALHTASICIHRVGAARGKGSSAHAGQAEGAAARLLTAANEIFSIVKSVRDPQRLSPNPFAAFASFMAALVYFDDFAHFHSRQSEERLGMVMDLMVVIANENMAAASLALQLAGHLKKTGIDPDALDKVKHLADKVESDTSGFVVGMHNEHTGTVLFCPFQPRETSET